MKGMDLSHSEDRLYGGSDSFHSDLLRSTGKIGEKGNGAAPFFLKKEISPIYLAFKNWIYFWLFLINLFILLPNITYAADLSATFDLLNEEIIEIPPPVLRLIERQAPAIVKQGIVPELEKIDDPLEATLKLCATVLNQSSENYRILVNFLGDKKAKGARLELNPI